MAEPRARAARRPRLPWAATAAVLVLSAGALSAGALSAGARSPGDRAAYAEDIDFLLDEIEQKAGALLREKDVDWKAARKRFTKDARKVRDDVEHLRLVERVLAAARDGHAGVTEIAFEIPDDRQPPPRKGVGMTLCLTPRKVLVKDCFGPAASSGVKSGFEVVKIDGQPARKWVEARAEELGETNGYSTERGALYAACNLGMSDVPGTSWSFQLKGDGGSKSLTLTCAGGGGNGFANGPVFPPADAERLDRASYAMLEDGIGWIHLRKVPDDLPAQLDTMLAALGTLDGLVLDMRANGGGGTDHGAVFSRFLEAGEDFGGVRGEGDGAHYSGPMVVLVDGGCLSAGETVSGWFKESGRALVIGPEGTAGMSGEKATVTLPSGLMTVRFTIRSYRAGGGPEIEGHGVEPHEVVDYDGADLMAGRDTMLATAVERLREGLPKKVVEYRR